MPSFKSWSLVHKKGSLDFDANGPDKTQQLAANSCDSLLFRFLIGAVAVVGELVLLAIEDGKGKVP